MILSRANGLRMLHCLFQVAAAFTLFWGWEVAVFYVFYHGSPVTYQDYVAYALLMASGLLIDHLRPSDGRTDLLNLSFIQNCQISFRQTVTVLVVLLLFLVGVKDQGISRVFLFSFIPPLYILLIYTNYVFPKAVAGFVFGGRYQQTTVLLGPASQIERVASWLERQRTYGVKLAGLVTDDAVSEVALPFGGIPVLGRPDQLVEVIRKSGATHVVAVGQGASAKNINGLADACHGLGVRLILAHDFQTALGRRVTMVEDDGIHFIGFHREPLESPFNRILKRLIDLTVALPVVVFVLPPLCVLVWVLHRLQSPGPLFFRQRRTGMRSADFMIYKFRTMSVNNGDEARQATQDDPRVFPAGRLLRKLSIDEVPQFLNVLTGEMSVVGPRPHLRQHDELFKKTMNAYGVRGFIKPGITGLAQVRDLRGEARTERDVVERVKSDLDYVENWSFLLDWAIIMRTVLKVLFPPKTSY